MFPRKGIPIGNLTSQIFANIYMNEFDQFIKHTLRVKNYLRYTDDFLIISENLEYLKGLINKLRLFLREELQLEMHPKKVSIMKYDQGIDFLGYVIFPYHVLLRRKTWKRIIRNIKNKIYSYKQGMVSEESLKQTLQSYLGVLSHAHAYKLSEYLKNQFWFWMKE
ncbi:MAG: RNA-directed DNA polymerase [Candidatus Taylorbacteria bacterium]|nr:RNA-directed DNA polymerase [Candidatus Taylorbacteria bacterium]